MDLEYCSSLRTVFWINFHLRTPFHFIEDFLKRKNKGFFWKEKCSIRDKTTKSEFLLLLSYCAQYDYLFLTFLQKSCTIIFIRKCTYIVKFVFWSLVRNNNIFTKSSFGYFFIECISHKNLVSQILNRYKVGKYFLG